MINNYLALSLLSLHCVSVVKAMDEPLCGTLTPPLLRGAQFLRGDGLFPVSEVVHNRQVILDDDERAQMLTNLRGLPDLEDQELVSPLREFTAYLELHLGQGTQGEERLSWRKIIPRLHAFPTEDTNDCPELTLEHFQQTGKPFLWGFNQYGKPFIAVAYTVEYCQPTAELKINPHEIFIQIFVFNRPNVLGNWTLAGSGRLGVTGRVEEFLVLANLIVNGFKESGVHGSRAVLRLAKITPDHNKP